ncbi:hypothetical protein ABEF93_002995 [Exophiala dermatitidis]
MMPLLGLDNLTLDRPRRFPWDDIHIYCDGAVVKSLEMAASDREETDARLTISYAHTDTHANTYTCITSGNDDPTPCTVRGELKRKRSDKVRRTPYSELWPVCNTILFLFFPHRMQHQPGALCGAVVTVANADEDF